MPIEVLNKDIFTMNDYRVLAILLSFKEKDIKDKSYAVADENFFGALEKPSDEGVVPYKGMTREEVIASLNRMTQDIKMGTGKGKINYKIIDKVEIGAGEDVKIYFSTEFLKEFRSPINARW